MNNEYQYYKKVAEIVHRAVIEWDPYGFIKSGAPEDEYDLIEKRFIGGLVNSESESEILNKVLETLDKYDSSFHELSYEQQSQLKNKINRIIEELKQQTANES